MRIGEWLRWSGLATPGSDLNVPVPKHPYDEFMADRFLAECMAVLTRTPATLDSMLRGLPEAWTEATEGAGTWSPHFVLGHLIHGEQADWIPRLEVILAHGTARPLDRFDRETQPEEPQSVGDLLDAFARLRSASLVRLRELNLQPAQLELQGMHPDLGVVAIRQLLATWTAHDLAHILQISRVMAKRFKTEVGPWTEYLSVMR
jgi:hypothetical protein